MAYLEKNNLLFCDEFMSVDKFSGYRIIDVPVKESYAANSIWVNETVIMPSGYPQTRQKIRTAGYKTIEVDVSEYRKLDGGLSCLSLRF